MKTFTSSLIFIAAVFAFAECLPPALRDQTDLVFVPLESSESEYSDEFAPEGPAGFSPFGFSFPNIFSGFDAMIRRFADSFRQFAMGSPENLGNVTNATSTQQVIDGHVVTINDTTYTKKGNYSDSVFVVRVIDVKPTEMSIQGNTEVKGESTELEEPVPSVESIESIKNEDSNEIPKGQTGVAETFDDIDSERADLHEKRGFHSSENLNDIDNDVDNSIDEFPIKPISLAGDINVNKWKENTKGGMFMVPDDVELINVDDGKPIYSYYPFPPTSFKEKTQKIVT